MEMISLCLSHPDALIDLHMTCLGQLESSRHLDLRSIFDFFFKQEKHYNAKITFLPFLYQKLFLKKYQ